ncbi:hypothetical protein R5R35_008098 [Gryllus longicercus]|uniref:Uncharacterized protein n=1 Tax=Gryllus longicercus TaxID=2509291 RepID=A0AAN9Z5I1_9ORTH
MQSQQLPLHQFLRPTHALVVARAIIRMARLGKEEVFAFFPHRPRPRPGSASSTVSSGLSSRPLASPLSPTARPLPPTAVAGRKPHPTFYLLCTVFLLSICFSAVLASQVFLLLSLLLFFFISVASSVFLSLSRTLIQT